MFLNVPKYNVNHNASDLCVKDTMSIIPEIYNHVGEKLKYLVTSYVANYRYIYCQYLKYRKTYYQTS